MAPLTVLLYCYRLPHITPAQFRTYCEETHVPLVKSLLGPDHPTTHTRYYTNKDSGYMVDSPSSTDPDLIAVIEYDSMEAMQRSMSLRTSDEIRPRIEADEDEFMDRSRVKVVVLGEDDVGRSVREIQEGSGGRSNSQVFKML